jgi:hypothetical protein
VSHEADNDQARSEAVAALQSLPNELEQKTGPLLAQVKKETNAQRRSLLAAEIRRLWRGI